MIAFEKYRDDFEQRIIVCGVKSQYFGRREQVPINSGRLSRQLFGSLMGKTISSSEVLAVDYYGFLKKSDGFFTYLTELRSSLVGKQIKLIKVPVVHFAAIRLEKVAKLAPDLVSSFSQFKKTILDARGFVHNYEV